MCFAAGRYSVSTKWLCHFVEFFPRCTALWLRFCAAVCSDKEETSSKFLRKPPHMSLVFDLKLEDFGPPMPPGRFLTVYSGRLHVPGRYNSVSFTHFVLQPDAGLKLQDTSLKVLWQRPSLDSGLKPNIGFHPLGYRH